jgi:hypothetical protein
LFEKTSHFKIKQNFFLFENLLNLRHRNISGY